MRDLCQGVCRRVGEGCREKLLSCPCAPLEDGIQMQYSHAQSTQENTAKPKQLRKVHHVFNEIS